jgi:uncharacterized membrane protein
MKEQRFPRSTAKIAGRPIHPMTVAIPITLLIATFVLDVAFALTGDPTFAHIAYWTLLIGILAAALAAIFGFTDYLGNQQIRNLTAANIHMIGNLAIVLLSIINVWIRSRNGSDSVPTIGIILSAIVFIAIHVTGWMGWTMVYRHRVGVSPPDDEAPVPTTSSSWTARR